MLPCSLQPRPRAGRYQIMTPIGAGDPPSRFRSTAGLVRGRREAGGPAPEFGPSAARAKASRSPTRRTSPMIGQTIRDYEVLGKLGAGGTPSFGLICVRTSATLADAKERRCS